MVPAMKINLKTANLYVIQMSYFDTTIYFSNYKFNFKIILFC